MLHILILVTLVFSSSTVYATHKMTVVYATLAPGLSPGWMTSEKRIWRKHGLDSVAPESHGPRSDRRSAARTFLLTLTGLS
jgi:hypothetical protein